MIGSQQEGDTVVYCREHELRRNGRSRLTGFEKDKICRSEARPQDSIFVRISIDCLQPCTAVELSTFHYTQTEDSTSLETEARAQRGFIEGCTTLAEPSQTVDDDRDDEMSEPTQTMNAEKRKVDETAKESRAPLPITTFPHASSTRPEDESHEQHTVYDTSQNRKEES